MRVETGEEIDKDLWMLVEELRDQNRKLIEKSQLKKEANGEGFVLLYHLEHTYRENEPASACSMGLSAGKIKEILSC